MQDVVCAQGTRPGLRTQSIGNTCGNYLIDKETPIPRSVLRVNGDLVEMILTEQQLAYLKAAMPLDSEESAALNRGQRFGSGVEGPEPIAVHCSLVIAARLLRVAQRSCPDIVPKIRAAMEEARQEEIIDASSAQASADVNAITLRLNTARLRRAVHLLADYRPDAVYP